MVETVVMAVGCHTTRDLDLHYVRNGDAAYDDPVLSDAGQGMAIGGWCATARGVHSEDGQQHGDQNQRHNPTLRTSEGRQDGEAGLGIGGVRPGPVRSSPI